MRVLSNKMRKLLHVEFFLKPNAFCVFLQTRSRAGDDDDLNGSSFTFFFSFLQTRVLIYKISAHGMVEEKKIAEKIASRTTTRSTRLVDNKWFFTKVMFSHSISLDHVHTRK